MKRILLLNILLLNFLFSFSQWKPTNGLFSGSVQAVVVNSGEIIVGTKYIYKSSDWGKTWYKSNNGITGSVTAIRGLAKSGSNLVAISDAGAFYSSDNGNNWTISSGTSSLNIWCLVTDGTILFMSTNNNGVYKSINNGVSWSPVNSGINTAQPIYALAVKGTDVYAGSDGYGIYKSINSGVSWDTVNTGLPGSYGIGAMIAHGNNIYAGTAGSGMYRSTDNGAHWIAMNNGISGSDYILGMAVNGNSIYASTLTGFLYKTIDSTNWNTVSIPTYITTRYQAFYSASGVFYVGTWGVQGTEKSYGLFRTKDDGTTWQQIGITDFPVSVLEVSGNNILGGTNDITGNSYRVSLFQTTEMDSTWSYNFGGFNGKDITALKASGAVVYLFDNEDPGSSLVYRSTNNGNNWTSTGFNALYNDFVTFAIAGSYIYAGDNSASYPSGHVFVSSDNGGTWNPVNGGFGAVTTVYSLALNGTTLLVATDDGIYKNTVGYTTWNAADTGLPTSSIIVKSLYVMGSTIYAGTQGDGIYESTNNGSLWTSVSTGLPLFADITSFTSSGNFIVAGTDNGVFMKLNSGTTWSGFSTGLIDTSMTVMTTSANYLWAGTTSMGVWRRPLADLITGLGKNYEEPSFSISPNPATNNITIDLGDFQNEIYDMRIYDVVGNLILEKNVINKKTTIDVSNLAKGVYIAKLYNIDNIQTKKFVVQ